MTDRPMTSAVAAFAAVAALVVGACGIDSGELAAPFR
jgi:hypothetical protein